jgi:predicted GIY-YIG superfamily endonuclease
MYVYLITNNLNQYKIGISKNPKRRIKELQTGNDSNLFIVNQYKSEKHYKKIETALHHTYKHCNVINEWFELTNDQASMFISECIKIENNLIFMDENKIVD